MSKRKMSNKSPSVTNIPNSMGPREYKRYLQIQNEIENYVAKLILKYNCNKERVSKLLTDICRRKLGTDAIYKSWQCEIVLKELKRVVEKELTQKTKCVNCGVDVLSESLYKCVKCGKWVR